MQGAYSKYYLNNSMRCLGSACDCSVFAGGLSLKQFFEYFLASGLASDFEQGSPWVNCSLSGSELVALAVYRCTGEMKNLKYSPPPLTSPEFAFGCGLAYSQWRSGRSFEEIFKAVPVEDAFNALSSLPDDKPKTVAEHIEKLLSVKIKTRLQQKRKEAGLSQLDLAELSGVPIRSIRSYEQHPENINKASLETVQCLARALCCDISSLIHPAL